MLYYALCLSYHSNTEAALFACISSGWATTTGRLLGPKMWNSIKCLSPRTQRRATASKVEPRFRNLSITNPALNQLSYATTLFFLWAKRPYRNLGRQTFLKENQISFEFNKRAITVILLWLILRWSFVAFRIIFINSRVCKRTKNNNSIAVA